MPRGGYREGAGRPKGARSAKSIAREDRVIEAIEAGVTPLEVMLNAMRDFLSNGDIKEAVSVAKDAAPYIHPKLAAGTLTTEQSGSLTIKWETDGGNSYTLRAAQTSTEGPRES